MTSKISCFDRAVFRRALKKTAPVWILYTLYELLLPLRLFGRFFRLRLGFFAAASGHVGRAYRAGRIDFPGFAFFRTGADSGGLCFGAFPVLQKCEKVCVVHLI